jgi:hypothetical protein
MSRRTLGVGLVVAAALGAVRSARGDGTAEPDLRALVADVLQADEPRRKAATSRLESLGVDVLPGLVRALPEEMDEAGTKAAADAVAVFGVDRCLSKLMSHRSRWQYAASRSSVLGLLVELRRRRDPRLARVVALKPGASTDADLLPPELCVAVGGEEAGEVGGHPIRARKTPSGLQVDVRGDGSFSQKIAPGRTTVVRLGDDGKDKPVLFFELPSGWHAGPAATYVGVAGKDRVEALDGDFDGAIGSAADRLRWTARSRASARTRARTSTGRSSPCAGSRGRGRPRCG